MKRLPAETDAGPKRALGRNWPEPLTEEEVLALSQFLNQRFGIPLEVLEEILWVKKGHSIYCLRNSPFVNMAKRYNVEQVGIRVLSFRYLDDKMYLAPTKNLITVFGCNIKGGRILVDLDDLDKLKQNGIDIKSDISSGYVVLSINDIGDFGIGYYKNNFLRLLSSWL